MIAVPPEEEPKDLANKPDLWLHINPDYTYVGIQFSVDSLDRAWLIICPCGVEAYYPINGLPTKDTPHPCGNPKHWTIKFAEATR